MVPISAVTFFMPALIQQFGWSPIASNLASAIPYAAASGTCFVRSNDTRTILFSGSSAVAAILYLASRRLCKILSERLFFRLLLSPSAHSVAAVTMYFNSRASDRAGDRFVYATLVTLGSALFFLLLAVRCAAV
jgi:hypothetical protein